MSGSRRARDPLGHTAPLQRLAGTVSFSTKTFPAEISIQRPKTVSGESSCYGKVSCFISRDQRLSTAMKHRPQWCQRGDAIHQVAVSFRRLAKNSAAASFLPSSSSKGVHPQASREYLCCLIHVSCCCLILFVVCSLYFSTVSGLFPFMSIRYLSVILQASRVSGAEGRRVSRPKRIVGTRAL